MLACKMTLRFKYDVAIEVVVVLRSRDVNALRVRNVIAAQPLGCTRKLLAGRGPVAGAGRDVCQVDSGRLCGAVLPHLAVRGDLHAAGAAPRLLRSLSGVSRKTVPGEANPFVSQCSNSTRQSFLLC